MPLISFKHKGNFNNIERFFTKVKDGKYLGVLEKYGQEGVDALSLATPVDSGKTAQSWKYEIKKETGRTVISWYNTNEVDGVNIAIILQYGHGTGTGGYVTGIDYINPAMKPVFDRIAEEAWKEVSSS